jgi:hypothetical protein
MAINIFRNINRDLAISGDVMYTVPLGYSGIVLSAQISNTTGSPAAFSLNILNTDSSLRSLVTDFLVPGNDSASALIGKLVLEQGQGLFASASDDTSLQLVLSVLESQN